MYGESIHLQENHPKSTIHVGKYTIHPMDPSWVIIIYRHPGWPPSWASVCTGCLGCPAGFVIDSRFVMVSWFITLRRTYNLLTYFWDLPTNLGVCNTPFKKVPAGHRSLLRSLDKNRCNSICHGESRRNTTVVGWLNQPIWKYMLVKLDHFPKFRGEHKTYLISPPFQTSNGGHPVVFMKASSILLDSSSHLGGIWRTEFMED